MKAWDIYRFQPQNWPQAHPAVIVSHSERVANKPEVTILMLKAEIGWWRTEDRGRRDNAPWIQVQ